MSSEETIKKYYELTNSISVYIMYLKQYVLTNELKESDLKDYNPGHLGTSLSINFILSNLYYFLNQKNLTNQLVIGTGHSGLSLISNLWLNGTLYKYYKNYSQDINGLNNLINDFGVKIRSEINPEYPETIYDGGELGYSLGVSYGYALDSKVDLVTCIIGDGEAESGTLNSSWQLNKLLNLKSKVLPIINLNGYKMGNKSYLSLLTNEELINHFSSFGYDVFIVDAKSTNILASINKMQEVLNNCLDKKSPLIIFKSHKGFTLPTINNICFEDLISVHKNPLQGYSKKEKINIIKSFLNKWNSNIFEDINIFNKFKTKYINYKTNDMNLINYEFDKSKSNIENLELYLIDYFNKNKGLIFSPDELYSNKLGKLKNNCIEILNENLLQALYQGYIQSGNRGLYISYEGFMPIISSMISQYYKYLKQTDTNNIKNSLNYILTSTCWENCYSHQNPDFINTLLMKKNDYYNVYFPKDGIDLINILDTILNSKNKINVITTSKRHEKVYSNIYKHSLDIDIIVNQNNPDLILCATGDYMLDYAFNIYNLLNKENKIKLVYITNPNILDMDSINSLNTYEFNDYFNKDVPIIYFFAGYPNIIKSLLFKRSVNCIIKGYVDGISAKGYLDNILESNGLNVQEIINLCNKKIKEYKEENNE